MCSKTLPLWPLLQMSDFPTIEGPNETNDIAAALENLKKKNSLIAAPGSIACRPPVAASVALNQTNAASTAQTAAQQVNISHFHITAHFCIDLKQNHNSKIYN